MEQSYKEKYEQAIERLKQWDREHPCGGYVVSDRDKFIFPELAESEGEKVRKELIKHLKELSDWKEDEVIPVKNPSYYRQWASWLEKQGQVKESFISQHENKTCKENDDSLTSEDDRIREALVEMVHDTTGDELWIDYNVHKEEALDWLERQGEHANFRNKIQVGDKVTRNEDGVLVNLSQLKRVAKPREKQCEQKFEMKSAEENLGIGSNTYNKIVDECIFGEQKPADKVEPKFKVGDKIYLKPEYRMPDDDTPIANTVKEIKRIDDKHYRFDGSYIFVEDQDKYELVEQKPAEWSEEDEQHIDSLLKRLDALCRNKFERTRFAISEDRDWLKSIRPQNRWKPSDEQMEILLQAVAYFGVSWVNKDYLALQSLYFDLKKLKEGKV